MTKTLTLLSTALMASILSLTAQAGPNDSSRETMDLNTENCVGSKWKDASGNTISMDDKFGAGTLAATRCLKKTHGVKVLYQINTLCKDASCTAPFAIGNIQNHINDMKITHGMTDDDYTIAVVIHSAGWKLVLDNNSANPHAASNPFQSAVEALVANPRVNVMFCQNTAAKKNIKFNQMIKGIGFTTAGVSAVSDLQNVGYKYIQP